MDTSKINPDAVKSEIRTALINKKVNACPMAMRVAWHSSGTYDATTKVLRNNNNKFIIISSYVNRLVDRMGAR
jgi:hypothetical protein